MHDQGVEMIWIEECYTDILPPAIFERYSVTFAKELIKRIRGLGMKSVYYFAGNPHGKLDMILSTGADAYSFEESKKGFNIDIALLAEKVRGKAALVGNIDSIGVLQNGSPEDIRREIIRQVNAGKENGGRFITGVGSPVTPLTPMSKIIDFLQAVRELAYI